MSTMRVAVAGTGGLACLIGHYIREEMSHHVVFLSRSQQPQLVNSGYQVVVVDYANVEALQFALRGIDTVISTITGPNQIELILGAVSARVRRFIPAEFEGPPHLRSARDPSDRDRTAARQWLVHYSQHIESTYFVCGVFYEHFQPGGLARAGIGQSSGLNNEGAYIMNCRTMVAQAPAFDRNDQPHATICMTSVRDVARYVCKALDLPVWPPEIRLCGLQIRIWDLIQRVQGLRGQSFNVQWSGSAALRLGLENAVRQGDTSQERVIRAHLNTSEGLYDFHSANLNQFFLDHRMIDFDSWFTKEWSG